MLVSLSVLMIQDGKGRRSAYVYNTYGEARDARHEYVAAHWNATLVVPITGEAPLTVYSPREDGEFAEIIDTSLVDIPLSTHPLIVEALAFKADAFQSGRPVNAEDVVQWFGEWRKRLIASLDRSVDAALRPVEAPETTSASAAAAR